MSPQSSPAPCSESSNRPTPKRSPFKNVPHWLKNKPQGASIKPKPVYATPSLPAELAGENQQCIASQCIFCGSYGKTRAHALTQTILVQGQAFGGQDATDMQLLTIYDERKESDCTQYRCLFEAWMPAADLQPQKIDEYRKATTQADRQRSLRKRSHESAQDIGEKIALRNLRKHWSEQPIERT